MSWLLLRHRLMRWASSQSPWCAGCATRAATPPSSSRTPPGGRRPRCSAPPAPRWTPSCGQLGASAKTPSASSRTGCADHHCIHRWTEFSTLHLACLVSLPLSVHVAAVLMWCEGLIDSAKLWTLPQDIAYSSDRGFAEQKRSDGAGLDWELEASFSCIFHAIMDCLLVTNRLLHLLSSLLYGWARHDGLIRIASGNCRTSTSGCSRIRGTRHAAEAGIRCWVWQCSPRTKQLYHDDVRSDMVSLLRESSRTILHTSQRNPVPFFTTWTVTKVNKRGGHTNRAGMCCAVHCTINHNKSHRCCEGDAAVTWNADGGKLLHWLRCVSMRRRTGQLVAAVTGHTCQMKAPSPDYKMPPVRSATRYVAMPCAGGITAA